MRVILIEEERFTEITQMMRDKASEAALIERIARDHRITEQAAKMIADEVHRTIHFYFVRWAQSHGASCTR